MGDTNPKASDPERRASQRTSRRISLQPEAAETFDLDDDDYSLMALGVMVSDGFRPAQPAAANNVSGQPEPAIRSPSPDLAESSSSSTATPRPHRSSISKPPRSNRDSLTLRHDGAMGHIPGPSLSRVSSASTDAAFIPVDGPYQGPSGPSHPYQMYSQNIRPTRTMSMATASTVPTARPESEYSGPTGPSHPYSMYPQNPIEVPTSQTTVPAIPVGFTNVPDMYQRRLGPEGEEVAAMIGPDGHTEELPPYTRYPDEFYARKIRANEVSAHPGPCAGPPLPPCAGGPTPCASHAGAEEPAGASTAGAAASAMTLANIPPSISGAGGIGLAARNPEFDARSVEDARSQQSRHSTRSFNSDSHHDINTAAAAVSEKPQLSKWQQFMKRKACGVIPYWAIGLTGGAVLIVIVIVAAVVGTLLTHHKKPPSPSSTQYQDSVPTITVTFDATPIATPSDLPALAQGQYGLPLNLNKSPNTCFNDTAQTQAWSCNIVFGQLMSLELAITRNAPQLGKDGNYEVWMGANSSRSGGPMLSYGASVPAIDPSMSMELVNDTFDLSRGPAWFRMTPYNKTVVVAEDLLSATSSTSKAKRDPNGGMFNTVGNFQRKGVAAAGDKPWICTWPDTFVEVFVYATQNSSYASDTSGGTITAPPSMTATPTATGTGSAATATPTDEVISVQPLSGYPRAVKVKERRVNQAPRPYCVQVEVLSDNSTQPVLDAGGIQVTIYIDEIEQSNGMDKRDNTEKWMYSRESDAGDMSDCGCMWFSS